MSLGRLQDLPKDADPKYLVGLSTTDELLRALQRAYTARCNIQANLSPVKVHHVQLPSQASQAPLPDFKWYQATCNTVAFSVCGQWLCVVVNTSQCCVAQPYSKTNPACVTFHEVLLYDCLDSFQEHLRLSLGSSKPIVQWSDSKPHLGVAQLPDQEMLAVRPKQQPAFILHVPTGQIMHSLGAGASPLFLQMMMISNIRTLIWSPSCQLLLIYTTGPTQGRFTVKEAEDCLLLMDVVHDRVLAQSRALGWTHRCAAAAWHPGSSGIVVSGYHQLEDVDAFRNAGIAVGILPDGCLVHVAGFSADAQHYVAELVPDLESRSSKGHSVLLACSMAGQYISFALVKDFPGAWDLTRLPGSTSLLVDMSYSRKLPSEVSWLPAASDRMESLLHAASSRNESRLFSPSGRLIVNHRGTKGLNIVDLDSCEQLWDVNTCTQPWPATGMEQHDSVARSSFKPLYAPCSHPIHQAWLPAGTGIVCCTPGSGMSFCIPGHNLSAPTILHILLFA